MVYVIVVVVCWIRARKAHLRWANNHWSPPRGIYIDPRLGCDPPGNRPFTSTKPLGVAVLLYSSAEHRTDEK